MAYLYSQLWLCLIITLLLGGLIGWFIRGDNRKKLEIIEKRWRKRFTDLEYINQSLNTKNKQGVALEKKYKLAQSRITRMNHAAELSSQELQLRNTKLAELQAQLDEAQIALSEKDAQLEDMISRLSELESQETKMAPHPSMPAIFDQGKDKSKDKGGNKTKNTQTTPPNTYDKNVSASSGAPVTALESRLAELEEKVRKYRKKTNKLNKLLESEQEKRSGIELENKQVREKNDTYKAYLIDAESKLQVTKELLEQCQADLEDCKNN